MLVCCRMIDDLRMVLLENTVDTILITYRADLYYQVKLWMLSYQFLLNIICIILINVEDDQLLWSVFCNLSAQLTSD